MTGHSEQLNDLAAALVKAQSEMHLVAANSAGRIEDNGDSRSYRYADLTSVWATVRKPLAKHGLSVIQTCEPGSRGELRLTTTLLHESGQWVSGTESLPLLAPTPQAYGSALTYARRYGLAAMLGVCVDDDDDGAAASKRVAAAPSRQQPSNHSRSEVTAPGAQQASSTASTAHAGQTTGTGAAARHGWEHVPYKRASELDLKAFAKAYAQARGLDSVSSEDIRRDFGVEGKLVDHFGATTLGDIMASAGSAAPQADGDIRSQHVEEPRPETPRNARGS